MNDPVKQYLTTGEVAKILSLSVGTVQQMVSNGILKASRTTGGHRRIPQESLAEYCKNNGKFYNKNYSARFSSTIKSAERVIYVIHANKNNEINKYILDEITEVRFFSSPLALLDQEKSIDGIFIDSHCEWLQDTSIEAIYSFLKKHCTYIYNWSDSKSNDLNFDSFPEIKKLSINVNIDYIKFYLLGKDSFLQINQHH